MNIVQVLRRKTRLKPAILEKLGALKKRDSETGQQVRKHLVVSDTNDRGKKRLSGSLVHVTSLLIRV